MGRRATVFVLMALLVAGVVGAVRSAARFLVVSDRLPTRADAIIVLAGSPAARLLEAAHLYREGRAPRIVLTRERRPPDIIALAAHGIVVPEPHEDTRDRLLVLGVPEDAVTVLHGRAGSTTGEARLIARWACRSRVRSLIVVTSPSHTRRARLILHRLLGPGIAFAVHPARADFFPVRHWWRSRRTSKRVLTEYQKLVNYWLNERWRLAACGR